MRPERVLPSCEVVELLKLQQLLIEEVDDPRWDFTVLDDCLCVRFNADNDMRCYVKPASTGYVSMMSLKTGIWTLYERSTVTLHWNEFAAAR